MQVRCFQTTVLLSTLPVVPAHIAVCWQYVCAFSYGGMKPTTLFGNCWLDSYGRHITAHKIGFVYSYCPSGYEKLLFTCASHCRGGYTGRSTKCYRHSCGDGYTMTPLKNVCIPHTRIQQWDWSHCNHYQHLARSGTQLTTQPIFGGCVQQCKQGDTNLLGFCYPPSVLRVSIASIFDPFKKIIDYIKNTDLSEYLTAIHYV